MVLAILVGSAHAETQVSVRWGNYTEPRNKPALVRVHGVEDATVDGVNIAIHGDATSVHATLTFRVSTRRREARAIRVPIEVTAGTLVTGMSYSLGGEPVIEAIARDASYALSTFNLIVARGNDPALLRRTKHDFKRDTLELAVFPVTRGMPAAVTIEMRLPPATRLVLDPGPKRAEQTFELPEAPEAAELEYTPDHVDDSTSLYAGDEPLRQARIERRPRVMPTVRSSDRRYDVRVAIREHAKELGHCYELGQLLEPTLSSAAQLTIDIAARGTVERVDVAVDNDDVRRCVIDEASSWLFSETDNARQVRQDINLAHVE